MSYNYHEQTCSVYKNIKYGQGTIYSSGCGPASLCNALDVLGIASVTVKTMCSYAVSVGARVSGGTDMHKLLQAAAKKYGFTYRTTSKNTELLAHLKAGGAAIVHAGSSYPLFSNGGHFVCAVAASGNDVTVLDSYWYSNKYTSTALRRNNVKAIERGIVRTGITQIGKATADRSPSYYLITKNTDKKMQSNQTAKKEDDDMTYYKTIADVPTYYRASVQKLIDKGFLQGTGKGEINVSEDFCRIVTVNDRAGLYGD